MAAKKVEQITHSGEIVEDFDQVMGSQEISSVLRALPGLELISHQNPYQAKFKGFEIQLCVKNVTYLGHPHPLHKKRIQISKEYREILQKENTFLMGIYNYDGAITLCLFDTRTYRNRQSNNSSAHVHTMDLRKARQKGVFEKTDKFENRIVAFAEESFEEVFDSMISGEELPEENEIVIIKNIFEALPRELSGVSAIQEMCDAKDPNALQAEWPGFYVEYHFKEYLRKNPRHKQHCLFTQNKNDAALDLDVFFPKNGHPGDLKAHTIGTDILGNDRTAISDAIEGYGKVWYIVLGHETTKDKDKGGSVTRFWNEKLNLRNRENNRKTPPKKEDSYLSRMKHSVKFRHLRVLEIMDENFKYLKVFNQGQNSNQKPRSPKISIKKSDIDNDNFVILRVNLD